MSKSEPQTCSKSDLYCACDIRHAMQAVSGKPISWVSTGGCCACSASGLCNLYPVARASQNSAPTNDWSVLLKCNRGNCGSYVYRCAVRLPARKWNVPG